MAVAYNVGAPHALDGGSTDSSGWGLTVANVANRFLLLAIGAWDSASGGGTPTVSFAGHSMGSPILSLTNSGDSSQRLLVWGLIAPPVGPGTFTITYPSTVWYAAEVAAVYTGVHQVTPYGQSANHSGSSAGSFVGSWSGSLVDAAGLIVGATLQWSNTVAEVSVHFGDMTKRDSGDDNLGAGGTVTTLAERVDPGSGSAEAFDYDFINSSTWTAFALELLSAAAAGAPRPVMEIH